MRHRSKLVAAVLLSVVGLMAGSCSKGSEIEAFCAAAENSRAAGPLFPDRTDGEPVPNQAALEALVEMSEKAPTDISDQLSVVLDEARILVSEAQARAAKSHDRGEETRPERSRVDAAQAATIEFVTENCGLKLSS